MIDLLSKFHIFIKAQLKSLESKDKLHKLQDQLLKLQDKFIKRIDQLNLDKNKIILIILACFILVYLDLSLVMKLQVRKISALKPKIIKLKKDINNLKKELLAMEDLQKRRREVMPSEPARKSKKVISETEISTLLEYISNLARKDEIRIIQIKPTKEINVADKKSKVLKGKALLKKIDFTPLFMDLSLICEYHHLGAFINKLENSEYFFAVEEMLITEGRGEDYLSGQDIKLILKTYVRE